MREGIYVGNKEVTKRYIGNSLVWEKLKLLFSGKVTLIYSGFTRPSSTKSYRWRMQKLLKSTDIK